MTIVTRTTAKSFFETGDKPTQAQFGDFIDSTLFYEDTSDFGRSLVSASAAVSARGLLGSGVVGDKVFTAITTASAQNNIGGGAVGKTVFEAITTASAQNNIGGGVTGKILFESVTTASAQQNIGGGTAGRAIFEATTTASAQNILINYVQGTFTPTVTLVGGAGNTVPQYTVNSGRYTRIGNRVFCTVELSGDGGNEGAGTGQINIALPIAISSSAVTSTYPAGIYINNVVIGQLIADFVQSASTISLYYFNLINSVTSLTGADQNNASRKIELNFDYEV